MASEKVTDMVLNIADLKCPCCYKKVKKLLCKFPQVRNQVFDEKQNTVSITVVCCNPEEIRHKLAKKGGKTVKSVEIKESPKSKEIKKPKSHPKPDKPKDDKKPDKPKVDDNKPDKPKVDDKKPDKTKVDDKKPDKTKGDDEKPKGEPKVEKHKEVPTAMMMAQVPIGYPYEVGYLGQPSGYGYDYGRGYMPVNNNNNNYGYRGEYYANNYYNNNNRPYDYLNEENPTGCAIM